MKKVAIVGFAGTKDMAPYEDPSFDIWTVNNLYKFVPRSDRIFQMHKPEDWAGTHHGVEESEHLQFLMTTDIPIYMQEKYTAIPASVRYPIEDVVEAFGLPRANGDKDAYFTNSISFMIALAILEGYEEIHVYGVDMAVGTEYDQQRPSCEYYLGIAKGRGIKVHLPVESDLLKTRFMYGYDEEQKRAWDLKVQKTINEMTNRKAQSDHLIRQQQSVSDKYEGAITALMEMDRTWQ